MTTSSLIVEVHNILNITKIGHAEIANRLLAQKGDLLTLLNHYLSVLDKQNVVLFKYMNDDKKVEVKKDLQITYNLLLAQKTYEITHQKTENLYAYDEQLVKCQYLLDALINEEEGNIMPHSELQTDGNPIHYLFMAFGLWFGEQLEELTRGKTKAIKNIMGWGNEKRLFWVWENSLFKSILSALPDDFFNVLRTKGIVKMPDTFTGTLSWGLYYFRGSLELFLLLKHTIAGPWMSEEERTVPWQERFMTQWDQRKFALLNDFVWATGNCLCFFLLVGPGALGSWGDAVTLILLVFDITLTIWQFEEKQTAFNKEMLEYDTEIGELNEIIDTLDDTSLKTDLHLKRDALIKAKDLCQKNWNHEVLNLKLNIGYAVGLMIAFAIMTLPFLPISGGAVLILGLTGAALCFAFTVLYNVIKGGLEIRNTYTTKQELQEAYQEKILVFIANRSSMTDDERKFLFLEIKSLMLETEYQKQLIAYQTLQLIKSLVMETVFPAMVLASLVFLPLSTGIMLIAEAILLSVASDHLMKQLAEPEKQQLKEFDEEEYDKFDKNPLSLLPKSSKSQHMLFKTKTEEKEVDAGYDGGPEDNGAFSDSSLCHGQ